MIWKKAFEYEMGSRSSKDTSAQKHQENKPSTQHGGIYIQLKQESHTIAHSQGLCLKYLGLSAGTRQNQQSQSKGDTKYLSMHVNFV